MILAETSKGTHEHSSECERRDCHCLQVQEVCIPPSASALAAGACGSGSNQDGESSL